ncbi:MAG TPA: crossover junction endodeoxyribonuclease RuvC [Gemmatimonadaceae bacterium]|nr:crossover junction endodeoxyribonuclease RuvC [Gemmatimonadaceae bacterium]
MLVLGLDPGTAVTGFGVVRGEGANNAVLVECGVFRTSPKHALADRLVELYDGVTELIERHRPEALSVESIFYARNVRTTITLGHARGVLLLAGARAGIPIHEYPPAEIKKAITGTGAATKEQVQYMVKTLLRLKTVPSPNDAADGVAAALTCILTARTSALMSDAGRSR